MSKPTDTDSPRPGNATDIKAAALDTAEKPAVQKKKSLLKRLLILVLILAVFAALIYGYWYFNWRGYVSTDDAFIDGDLISLGSKMMGRISELTADEGDLVSQGQCLVRLDDSDLQAQEAQVEANLELARQSVGLAKVNQKKAEDDFRRANIQYKSHVIPAEQFDHVSRALEIARAQLSIEEARVRAAQAQLHVIQTQLGNALISSPVAGVIAKKWALPGDVIQPGQAIFTVYDKDQVWVTANFEETKLAAIHPGDPVEISIDAYDGQKFKGTVLMIGTAAAAEFSLIPPNNASGNFTKVTQRVPVKISINRPAGNTNEDPPALLPGLSVEVKVRVDSE